MYFKVFHGVISAYIYILKYFPTRVVCLELDPDQTQQSVFKLFLEEFFGKFWRKKHAKQKEKSLYILNHASENKI